MQQLSAPLCALCRLIPGLAWTEVVDAFARPISNPVTPIRQNVSTYASLKPAYDAFEAAGLRQQAGPADRLRLSR